MYKCKRIMVGLDFTLLDKTLIAYVGFLSRLVKAEKVYFINVQKSLDVPPDLWSDFPEMSVPLDEHLKSKMCEAINNHFGEQLDVEVDCIVSEGSPLHEINHWAKVKHVDLVVVGQKDQLRGKGILPNQLLRSVPCCVLFVPEVARQRLNELMVAIDFSEASKFALEAAFVMSDNNPDATIYCQHIYQIPTGYYFTEKSKEEVHRVIKSYHVMQYNKFIENITFDNLHINPLFTLDEEGDTAQVVYNTATKKDIDLIVAGATGKTQFDSFILGSFTEKIVQLNNSIPLLIVNDKNNKT